MSATSNGPRCGECRLGLGVHEPRDPLCAHHGSPLHRGQPRRCQQCGRAEDNHNVRHAFRHPAYGTSVQPPHDHLNHREGTP